jgi:hypothetical protein
MTVRKFFSRLICPILAAVLVCALLPFSALAEEPSLVFGLDELGKEELLFLGKDSGHSSLQWRILDVDEKRALLITRSAVQVSSDWNDKQFIYCKPEYMWDYSDDTPPLDSWNKSQIRQLCGKLFNLWKSSTVNKEETYALLPYTAEETENYRAGRFDLKFLPSPVKNEKIFILSAKEAEQYFDGEADRICTEQGGNTPTWWWLRSPVLHNSIYIDRSYIVGCVDEAGWLNSLDVTYEINTAGLRPACQLDLSKILFVTAKDTKPKLSRDASLEPVARGEYGLWKLTLIDTGRKFSAETEPLTAAPGGTFSFAYTGAKTGSKEAVSVILCDKEGTPLYYGSLKAGKEGTAEFPVPGEIAPGEYVIKAFSELRNNGAPSDVASPAVEIGLTIQ